MKELLSTAIKAAYEGGKKIIEVYSMPFEVEIKGDNSPLTIADKKANFEIDRVLKDTGLPILSEEGKHTEYSVRKSWKRFWMVDPLDGTKEFIKRNGEFTVNIALIEDGVPVLGVIYVPVKQSLYFGLNGHGAFKLTLDQEPSTYELDFLVSKASRLPLPNNSRKFTAVGSRSHMSPETEAYFEQLKSDHGDFEVVSMGSSLKICLVAEGSADVYPRFAPTMEWDTAAGHGIARAAGKAVIDHSTGVEMKYNKENLLNNWFIVQ